MDFTSLEGVAYPPAAGTSYSGTSYKAPANGTGQNTKSQSGYNVFDRYFDYSGFAGMSYVTLGYTYSFMDSHHWLNVSLFDFRVNVVGLSPLKMEFTVSPWEKRLLYCPTARVYLPVTEYLAIVPYGGVSMDTGALGKVFKRDSDEEQPQEFSMAVVAGTGLNLSILKRMPIELKVEYRHPVINPTACASPQGIYLGMQLYFNKTF